MPRRVRPRSVTVSALAAAGLLSAANGALTGVGSAAPAPTAPPEKTATASVSVTCPFADPLGSRKLTVETTATLPTLAKTGTSATIGKYSAQFSLPRDVALSLLPAGATAGSLQGAVQLDLAVHQGERSDQIPVPLTVAPTPLPETGNVTLTATGTVPEIAINTIGSVTFDVTAPKLALAAAPAAPAPDAAGAPVAPPIACALDPDQQATLGTILVQPPATPGAEQKAALGAAAALDDEPPPNEYTVPLGLITIMTRSTVARLGATVVADPAILLNAFFTVNIDTGESRVSGSAVFKPATTTFLGFGFVPVTATVEFLPVDYRNSKMIEVGGGLFTDDEGYTNLRTELKVMGKLSGAKINGVPLDVGSDCVTKEPVSLEITGRYDPFTTGHVRTDPVKGFYLPPFRDCGSGGQDLTPLLSGMSTGWGNQAFIDTYNLNGCSEPDHTQCPPDTLPPPPGSEASAAKKAVTKNPN
ncbi:hypothetical protein QRX60_01860 [Amycolatopsis mongoliensis]|uniref:DUF6801 domain-containing protein n=1 Tax=Amycolatopsis mongoliensis TaxID=715475 RepID=A0A9Y2JQ57_9PSEU|nr:DUF6801 domain-containing protein [Amycolatopsis sp. 4-36]WIY02645.1 hypothetical protein QRX60_01860 [Amycolatopsis sp. 4-36]